MDASGQTSRTGGITKQGRRELRAALVEAAWIAVRHQSYWQTCFERLARRIGKHRAIVAIARKLLVVVWQVLTHQVADEHGEAPAVARKLMKWGSRHRTATRLGLSRSAFAQQHLNRLGWGTALEHPSSEEQTALMQQVEGVAPG